MKALSVRQPWASLIVYGIKDIENRSWRTKFRGRIYIHAPAKFEDGCLSIMSAEQRDVIIDKILPDKGYSKPYLFSAIIGSVEIVDCIRDSSSVWADPDCWHWILKDPILFDKPILNVKGKLSLWEYEDV